MPLVLIYFQIMTKILVLYASQTGSAQDVAERIGREALQYYFDPIVTSMDDLLLEQLTKEKLAIFVASTTGQGDDPDNMKTFFKCLWHNRSNRSFLKGLKYGVLGLGDSSYQKFNFASKRLNKLLLHLGASPIIEIGLADDQHDLGTDFVVDSWLKKLWDLILRNFPLPPGLKPIQNSQLALPKYKIKFVEKNEDLDKICGQDVSPPFSPLDDIISSKITLNIRKTSRDHFQDVRLIEFDIDAVSQHKPGDVVMIQPQNLDEHVEEFIQILGLEADKRFFIIPNKNVKFPSSILLQQPCTIRECVKNYFDILSVPRRYFFELLSHFTTDENEKEKFLEFTSCEGQQELYDYCHRPKRSILEVLADFPHTKYNIPFEYLFDLVPSIRPRAYSIASSAKALPGKIQILMAIVKYKTILKRPRFGLCSNWLAQLSPGSAVPLWIKKGSFTFPEANEPCPPVIMIGPGTGCAPFRAYIQERIVCRNYKNLVMIFGCRGKEKDYFFKEEWESLHKEGQLQLFCAFSRDQEDKVYVQHVMKENSNYLWSLISNEEARIYFAGNAKRIPIDVYEALQYICEKNLGQNLEIAEQYMKKNIEKRYQTESWA